METGHTHQAGLGIGEARRLFDTGAALFVDVRAAEEFEHSHIPGAVSVPLADLARRLSSLPGDRLLVTYCA